MSGENLAPRPPEYRGSVEIAKAAGTCFGVDRALALVRSAMAESPGCVSTLGPLIHNARVVDELSAAGVTVAGSPEDAAGRVLVLRSHGVTPEEEARAHELCQRTIDAACPFVKRVHHAVERLARAGRKVVVVGEPEHPEVRATCAYAPGARVVRAADEVCDLGLHAGDRVGLVAQTTLERAVFEAVTEALRETGADIELVDTICAATSERQEAASELAGEVDVMVVVGGRSSANTRHLAEICAKRCEPTYHVESAGEMDLSWLWPTCHVGITAGASTPQEQIREVEDFVLRQVVTGA